MSLALGQKCEFHLSNEEATQKFAQDLALNLPPGFCYLCMRGDLGAGKTTFTRALLRALGHAGAVRSPTYTLMESYELLGRDFVHMDLYRLADAEELEFLGLRDYLSQDVILLVEWPQMGQGFLPPPDFALQLHIVNEQQRRLEISAHSESSLACLKQLRGEKVASIEE